MISDLFSLKTRLDADLLTAQWPAGRSPSPPSAGDELEAVLVRLVEGGGSCRILKLLAGADYGIIWCGRTYNGKEEGSGSGETGGAGGAAPRGPGDLWGL